MVVYSLAGDQEQFVEDSLDPASTERISAIADTRAIAELHLAVPSPGDVGEDHAVTRLASTIAGTGVQVGKARFGQVTLVSSTRGLLRVNRDQLNQVNRLEGVLVMTGLPGCATDADANVAVVKCAPLFLPWQTLHAVEVLRDRDGPVVEVPGFCPRRIAFVAPADRLRGNAFERATTSLSTAVEWYGSSLDWVARAEPDVELLAEAFRDVVNEGAELLLTAGAAGTDPLDLVFEALRQAGGEVVQLGIPVEPGTACWIGSLDEPARSRVGIVRAVWPAWRPGLTTAARAGRRDARYGAPPRDRVRRPPARTAARRAIPPRDRILSRLSPGAADP